MSVINVDVMAMYTKHIYIPIYCFDIDTLHRIVKLNIKIFDTLTTIDGGFSLAIVSEYV